MRNLLLLFAISLPFIVQAQKPENQATNKMNEKGVRMVSVRQGKYKVWTRKINSGKIKLLLLAGGPGSSFEYFENFAAHLKNGYEIYLYSQLGSYLSDQPADSSLQTVDAYVEDLEEVRKTLGIDNFYLLGHSWATRLALAYTAKYQQHVKGLILSNGSGLGNKLTNYDNYQQGLWADIVQELPEFKQYADSIRNYGMSEKTHPELMEQIMKQARPVFVKQHFMRLDTVPDPVYRSRIHSNEPKMHWLVDDTQRQDPLPLLSAITVPTLFIGGRYDYIPQEGYLTAKKQMKNNRDVTIYITPNGSHRAMWDDADNYFSALRSFIERVNQKKPNPKTD
jgi:proline iminopeptidase